MTRAITLRSAWAFMIIAWLAFATQARADDTPKLESPSVVVLDAVTGSELLGKRADEARPIASMTKIFVAMALRRHHLALDRWTEINFDDAKASAGGAHTLLLEGRRAAGALTLHTATRLPIATNHC